MRDVDELFLGAVDEQSFPFSIRRIIYECRVVHQNTMYLVVCRIVGIFAIERVVGHQSGNDIFSASGFGIIGGIRIVRVFTIAASACQYRDIGCTGVGSDDDRVAIVFPLFKFATVYFDGYGASLAGSCTSGRRGDFRNPVAIFFDGPLQFDFPAVADFESSHIVACPQIDFRFVHFQVAVTGAEQDVALVGLSRHDCHVADICLVAVFGDLQGVLSRFECCVFKTSVTACDRFLPSGVDGDAGCLDRFAGGFIGYIAVHVAV